jgi:NAD(P)-dependent dehydrogenase (short-subunit alcohol dehydrogenase family)
MIARGFVEAGAKVYIVARKLEGLQKAAQELAQHGGQCIPLQADLSTEAGVLALAEAVKAREAKLHILVNNAGATWGARYEEYPEAAWDKLYNLNVKPVFSLTRALTPTLAAAATDQDPARVINISSVAAFGAGNSFAYGASKAAVNQLTRALARKLSRRRILVNAIAPGVFPSRMSAFIVEDPVKLKEMQDAEPLGRIGTPEDAAGVAIFLSSRASAWVTGIVVPVDGGGLVHTGAMTAS